MLLRSLWFSFSLDSSIILSIISFSFIWPAAGEAAGAVCWANAELMNKTATRAAANVPTASLSVFIRPDLFREGGACQAFAGAKVVWPGVVSSLGPTAAQSLRGERCRALLPTKYLRENEWRHDRGVRLDDELGSRDAQLAPGYLFVRHGSRVRAKAGRRITDLAEISPFRHLVSDDVLVKHRNHANRKIPRDSATDLKEADGGVPDGLAVPACQLHHVFDPGTHREHVADFPGNVARRVNVPQRRILPARDKDGQVSFRCGDHPTIGRINLVELLEPAAF